MYIKHELQVIPDSAISVFRKKRNETVGSWLGNNEKSTIHTLNDIQNNGHRSASPEQRKLKREEMKEEKDTAAQMHLN